MCATTIESICQGSVHRPEGGCEPQLCQGPGRSEQLQVLYPLSYFLFKKRKNLP